MDGSSDRAGEDLDGMRSAEDVRVEPEERLVLDELVVAFDAAIARLRVSCPGSSWICVLSLARRPLLRATGRQHLAPVESPPGPG